MAEDYRVPLFTEQGFTQRECPACRKPFWALGEHATCGETPCQEYTFIGASPMKKALTPKAMREEFLSFLEANGHARVRRYPVVARWREDVFFTQASVYPFQPWVINGDAEPPANPLGISQPCVRFLDIDNVGKTGRHLTLFEMMAHHVFNRPGKEVYWRDRTTELCHEFFTGRLGLPAEAITYKESWWQGGGNSGPCFEVISGGLEIATLVFMQYVEAADGRREMPTRVVDTGYGLERITWMSQGSPSAYEAVFGDTLGYLKRATGLHRTEERVLREYSRVAGLVSVDTPGDLQKVRETVAKRLGMATVELTATVRPFESVYAVVDHCRALLFLLADGVVPSNVKEGYFARLLVRRAMRALRALDLEMRLSDPVTFMIDQYKEDFPELLENRSSVLRLLEIEEGRYKESLERGREVVRRTEAELRGAGKGSVGVDTLVRLYDSHGLNPDLVQEFASLPVEVPDDFFARVAALHERGEEATAAAAPTAGLPPTRLRVYEDLHRRKFQAKVLAVTADAVVLDETYFYPEGGGQEADHGWVGGYRVHDIQKAGDSVLHHAKEASKLAVGQTVECEIDGHRRIDLTRHHTATHIVLGAARKVLGNHVWQTGAHKGAELARLDLTHYEALTLEHLHAIEAAANEVILEGRPVEAEFVPRVQAEARCGFRLYQGGSVPGGQLRVVRIPDWDCEACGGTHCHSTAEVGMVKILRAKRIQDGVVRLEFVAGRHAHSHVQRLAAAVHRAAEKLSVAPEELEQAVHRVTEELRGLRKDSERARRAETAHTAKAVWEGAEEVRGVRVVVHEVPEGPRAFSPAVREIVSHGAAVAIVYQRGEKAAVAVGCGPGLPVDAREVLAAGTAVLGGSGGGKFDFAQGGGPGALLAQALEAMRAAARSRIP